MATGQPFHGTQSCPTTMSAQQTQLASSPATSLSTALGLSSSQQSQQFQGQNFGGNGIIEHHPTQQQGHLSQPHMHQIQQQHPFSNLQHHLLESQQHSQQISLSTIQHHRAPENPQQSSFNDHQQQQQPNMPFGLHMNPNNNMGMGNVGPSVTPSPPLGHFYNHSGHHTNNMQTNQSHQQSGQPVNHLPQPSYFLPHATCSHSFAPHQILPPPMRNLNSSTVGWISSSGSSGGVNMVPSNIQTNPQCFNTFNQNNLPPCPPRHHPQMHRISVVPRMVHHPNQDSNVIPGGLEVLWREVPAECQKLLIQEDITEGARFRGYFTVCELIGLKKKLLTRFQASPKFRAAPLIIPNANEMPMPVQPVPENNADNIVVPIPSNSKGEPKKGSKRGRKDNDNKPVGNDKQSAKVKGKGSKKAKKELEKQQQQEKQQDQELQSNNSQPMELSTNPQQQDPQLPQPEPEKVAGNENLFSPEKAQSEMEDMQQKTNLEQNQNEQNNEFDADMMIGFGTMKRGDMQVTVPPAINEVEVSGGGGSGKNNDLLIEGTLSQHGQASEEIQQNVVSSHEDGVNQDGVKSTSYQEREQFNGNNTEDEVGNNHEGAAIERNSPQQHYDSGMFLDTSSQESSLISQNSDAETRNKEAQVQNTLTLFADAATLNDTNSSLPPSRPYLGLSHPHSQIELRGPGQTSHPPFRTLTLVLKLLKIGSYNIKSFSSINPNRVKIVFNSQRISYECNLPALYQSQNRGNPMRKVLMVEYGFDQIQQIKFKENSMFVKVGGTPTLSASFTPAQSEELHNPVPLSPEDEAFLDTIEKGSLRLTPYHEVYVLNERLLNLLQGQMKEFPKLRNSFVY